MVMSNFQIPGINTTQSWETIDPFLEKFVNNTLSNEEKRRNLEAQEVFKATLIEETTEDKYRDLSGQYNFNKPDGQLEAGNIDIWRRPQVPMPDGSIATVRTMGITDMRDGSQVNIPTIGLNGEDWTPDQAVANYYQTGQHLGKFDSIDNASRYAEELHKQQEYLIEANKVDPNFDVFAELRQSQMQQRFEKPVENLDFLDKITDTGKVAFGAVVRGGVQLWGLAELGAVEGVNKLLNAVGMEEYQITDKSRFRRALENPTQAQELIDKKLGISHDRRLEHEWELSEAMSQIKTKSASGILSGLWIILKNAPYMFFDNADLIAGGGVGGLAVKGIVKGGTKAALTRIAGHKGAKVVMAGAAALPSGLIATTAQDGSFYEKYGRHYTPDEFMAWTAINTALFTPVNQAVGKFASALFPKGPFKQIFNATYASKAAPALLKNISSDVIIGGAVGGLQSSLSSVNLESGINPLDEGFFEAVKERVASVEGLFDLATNAAMVGVPGVAATAKVPFIARSQKADAKARAEYQKEIENTTYARTENDASLEVDKQASADAIETAKSLPLVESSLSKIKELVADASLSVESVRELLKKRINILADMAKKGKELPDGMTKEQVFEELVLHSDPNGFWDTKGQRTEKAIQDAKDKLYKVAEEIFGKSKETKEKATKTIEEVSKEALAGTKNFVGVDTYEQNITQKEKELADLDSSSPTYEAEKARIEAEQRGFIHGLKGFRRSQMEKLLALKEAAAEIASGSTVNKIVNFIGGSKFELKGLNLLHNSFKDKVGVFKLFDSINEVISKADKILEPFNKDNAWNMTSFNKVSEQMNSLKEILSTISTKTEQELLNPAKSAITRVKERITGKETPSKPIVEQQGEMADKDVKGILKALRLISEAPTAKVSSKQLTALKVAYPKAETWGKLLEDYKKTSKPNQKVIDLIQSVVDKKQELSKSQRTKIAKRVRAVNNAEKAKTEFTKEAIDAMTDEEFNKAVTKFRKIVSDLAESQRADSEHQGIKDLAEYYRDTITPIIAERQTKISDAQAVELAQAEAELRKSIEEAKKVEAEKVPPKTPEKTVEEAPVAPQEALPFDEATIARDSFSRKISKQLDRFLARLEFLNGSDLVTDLGPVDRTNDITKLLKKFDKTLREYQELVNNLENAKEPHLIEQAAYVLSTFHLDAIVPIEREIVALTTQFSTNLKDGNETFQRNTDTLLNATVKTLFGDTFGNLSDELQSSKHASSMLGNVKVNTKNPFIKKILDVFENIRADKGKDNLTAWLYKPAKGETRSAIENAPHLQLMYDLILDGQKAEFKVRPEVAVAIDLAIRDYFTKVDISKEFNPTDFEELTKRFGEHKYYQIRAFTRKFGVPQTVIATRIGEGVLKNLGIEAKEDATKGYIERIAAGLGGQALEYAKTRKWVTIHKTLPPSPNPKTKAGKAKKYTETAKYLNADGTPATETTPGAVLNILEHPTTMVTFNWSLAERADGTRYSKTMEVIRDGLSEKVGETTIPRLDTLRLDSIHDKKPSSIPYTVPEDMKVRNTNDMMNVPTYVKKVMKKLFNTPFVVNSPLADFVIQNKDWVEKQLGIKDQAYIDNLPMDAKASAEGINQTISDQLVDLQELIGWKAPVNYFKWFFSRNGRIFMDSTHVNMQQHKSLQRYLITPQKANREFYFDGISEKSKRQIEEFHFTIAQTFKNLKTDIEIKAFAERVLKASKNRDMLADFRNDNLKKYYGIEKIENFGQALVTMQAINAYNAAKKAGKTSFRTSLMVENDSTTSGYAITFLQHPIESLIREYGSKVGILEEGQGYKLEELHNLKQQVINGKKFYDIYETIADRIEIPGFDVELGNKSDFYKVLRATLPEKENGLVTPELRDLVKKPTMTYNYGQGKASMITAMGHNLTEQLIVDFVDIMNGTSKIDAIKQENIKKVFEYVLPLIKDEKMTLESLSNRLKKQMSSDIQLTLMDRSRTDLNSFIADTLSKTYGEAVWKAMDDSFGKYLNEINASKSMIFNTMFDLFIKEFEYEVQHAKDNLKHGEKYSVKMEEAIIANLFDIMPGMRLAYDTMVDSGVLVMDSERAVSPENTVKSVTPDGTTNVTANIRKFLAAGGAGAVLPTHFIDGMIMAMMIEKYGDSILPIHDAIMGSGINSMEATRDFNKALYRLNKDFDMYSTLFYRFSDVVGAINERRKSRGDNKSAYDEYIHDENWKDFFSADKGKGKDERMTVNQFGKHVKKLMKANTEARDAFYNSNKKRLISNIDGVKGTAWEVSKFENTFKEEMFKTAMKNGQIMLNLRSDPNSWTPNSTIEHFRENGLKDPKVRIEIARRLRALDPKAITDREFDHFVRVILDRVNPDRLQDIFVTTEDFVSNTGVLKDEGLRIGIDNRTEMDRTTRLSPFTHKSLVEIYAHEIVHAGTRMPIQMHRELGFTKEVAQGLDLLKRAKKLISWETFMPKNYDPLLKTYYEENAKVVWESIFEDLGTGNLRGLHEFFSYGLTHAPMMEILRNNFIDVSDTTGKVKFLDRLISLGIALLDVFKGTGKIEELAKTGAAVLRGDLNLRNKQNIYKELVRLNDKMNKINQDATNKLYNTPLNALFSLFHMLGDLVIQGNAMISPFTKKAFNFVDELGLEYKTSMNSIHGGSFFDPVKLLGWIMVTPFSKSRKQVIGTVLRRTLGISQQGTLATILRDIQEPNQQTSQLEAIARFSRMTQQASIAMRNNVFRNLADAFQTQVDEKGNHRELNDTETKSLSRALLYTDLSNLAVINEEGRVTNMDEILSLLKNQNGEIQTRVKSLESELKTMVPNKSQYIWYMNSAKSMALHMTTGNGHLATSLNAYTAATGWITGHDRWMNVSQSVIDKIDTLATMYALQRTDPNMRNMAATLDVNGLSNMLNSHHTFKTESRAEKVTEIFHEVKGYHKNILDDTIDFKVDYLSEQAEMKKQGYEKVKDLGDNQYTSQGTLAFYKRPFNHPMHRQGAAFLMTGQHAIGTTLKEEAFTATKRIEEAGNIAIPVRESMNLHQIYFDRAMADARGMITLMQKKELNFDQLIKLGKQQHYVPVVSPNLLGQKAGISDFRVSMSIEDKVNHLGMNESAFEMLSGMYASKNTKLDSTTKNKILIQFLEKDMAENMSFQTKLSREGSEFIRMTRDSDNPFLREAWKAIPREFREVIKAYDREGQGFWVRNEWLQQLFGSPSVSLIDNASVKKYTNSHMKKWILITEHILKFITFMAKENIVIRYPFVLLSNVISNFNVSVSKGANPTKVFKMSMDNAKNISDYVESRNALNKIELKQRLKTVTAEELSNIGLLQAKIDNNPVTPLMDKGMYQAIVEDIGPNDVTQKGKIKKFLAAKFKNVPGPLKTVLNHMYLMQGNPYFDFMWKATQYSDFVARSTEYQLQLEKAQNKYTSYGKKNAYYIQKYDKNNSLTPEWRAYEEKVTTEVWNTFINYEKPQSSAMQYLSDMGLLMFTKFLTRVQHVIFKGLAENPVSSILYILFASQVMSTYDINEYSWPFMKTGMGNFFSPVGNAISATVPSTVQAAVGIGVYK